MAFHAVHTPVDAPAELKRLYDDIRFDAADTRHDSRLRLAAMVPQLDNHYLGDGPDSPLNSENDPL